jgi:RimJ/RimL family protein N-acetyltransferase
VRTVEPRSRIWKWRSRADPEPDALAMVAIGRTLACDPADAGGWQTAAIFALPLPIETARLRLRHLVPEDLAALHAIDAREDVVRWLYYDVRTEEESHAAQQRRLDRARDAPETGVTFAVETLAAGELVGHISFTVVAPEHRQGEIGFVFDPAQQGRGYATEASAAVLDLAFGLYGLHRVIGRTETRNVASVRVLEKLGMRREAHLIEDEWVKGEWQSEFVYALLAREWASPA